MPDPHAPKTTAARRTNHLVMWGNWAHHDILIARYIFVPTVIQLRPRHAGRQYNHRCPRHGQFRVNGAGIPVRTHVPTSVYRMLKCQPVWIVRDEAMPTDPLPGWVGLGGERKN